MSDRPMDFGVVDTLLGLMVGAIVGGLIGGLLLGVVGVLACGVIGAPVGACIGFFFGDCFGLWLEKFRRAKLTYLQKRALIELQGNKWHRAVLTLTKVIQSEPALIEAYHRRAIAYLALNEFDRAVADCNVLIKSDPTPITHSEAVPPYVADAYLHRGTAFARMGQHDKAIADFTDTISLVPRGAIPYERRAHSRRAIRDFGGAAEDERRALHLSGPEKGHRKEK